MTGSIRKMRTVHYPEEGGRVEYFWRTSEGEVPLNEYLGKEISIEYTGRIFCKNCGKKTNKSFSQGFCYPCFQNAPENAVCILHPELCRGHEGLGRDPEWEKLHHVQPHYVYLAYSTEVKVGVTRTTQGITRWIDQGAEAVQVIAEVPYRQLAGEIEVYLKDYFTDKTNWQRMLTHSHGANLNALKEGVNLAENVLPEMYHEFIPLDTSTHLILYPQLVIPSKVSSTNLEKEPNLRGKLIGIKGQYLLFEGGKVMNVRSMEGYETDFFGK
jgi:Protein of unknown function (DUF2797)